MFETSQERKVSFLLKDFNLYEDPITTRGENFILLELQPVKGTQSISRGEKLEFSCVFLFGNISLIREFHQELKGKNGIERLGKIISIELDENIHLENKLVNYQLLKNEISRLETLESSLDNGKVKVKEEFSDGQEKDSLLLNYVKESKKTNFFNVRGEKETNWWSTKRVVIEKLETNLSKEKKEEDIKERIRTIKEIRESKDETGEWIEKIFFSDPPKFKVGNKTPKMILAEWEAELVTINAEKTTHPSVSPTFPRKRSTFEETTWITEKKGTTSESKDEGEEVSHLTDGDKEREEKSETNKESHSTAPLHLEHEAPPIEEDELEEENVSKTDEEEVDATKVSSWGKIGKKGKFAIVAIVIIAALILVSVPLIIRKKKVNKTSPNKLQPEQPTDKKGIDYDPFVY